MIANLHPPFYRPHPHVVSFRKTKPNNIKQTIKKIKTDTLFDGDFNIYADDTLLTINYLNAKNMLNLQNLRAW